ncbi:MAG: GntR family transcriptional regulator [Spirochaetales bacterium]|jgi:DNA-binding GntR family transcriptional regulator|nr:GntR family transcriptional regulator [Spirochaetales bacterium]
MSRSVTDTLRQEIINGIYPAGEHITIRQLVLKYGVSEMPVREAFQCLKGEGLLELHQYKGARVVPLDVNDVAYIYDIRTAIEILILKEVIQKDYTKNFLTGLARINSSVDIRLPEKKLSFQYGTINNQFHSDMFTLSGNKRAKDMYILYSNLFRALKRRYPDNIENIKIGLGEHEALILALKDRDETKISELVARHSERAKNSLLQKMVMEPADLSADAK